MTGCCVALIVAACSDGAGSTTTTLEAAPPAPAETAATTAAVGTGAPEPFVYEPQAMPVVDPDPSGLRFTEVTDDAGVSFAHSTPWSAEDYVPEMSIAKMISGAGVIDYDNDGDPDIFIVGGGISHDALFRNDGDGTFTDVSDSAGIRGDLHLGAGVAVGDYDGDGWVDLFVSSHGTPLAPETGAHRLWRNNGDGTFTEVAGEAGVAFTVTGDTSDGFGSVFGDVDIDGDLDLFVSGWERDVEGDRLFENNGDGTFTDVTDAAGIVDDGIRGFSPCIVDTSGDGMPEILLVADFGTSRYFTNNADGTFTESITDVGAGLEWSGMGTAVADWNNDGLWDWYVSAIFDIDAHGRGDGNKLYLNRGGNRFDEVAAQAGVDDGGWGWGAVGADLDLDGWQDIVEVNGWHFEGYESYVGVPARVWLANGDETFREAAAATGLWYTQMGLGAMTLDYDGDGDLDLAFTSPNEQFRLYRNDLEADRSWLRVMLDTAGSRHAPNGIGATVTAVTTDGSYHRLVGGCSNYLTSSELVASFGLGDTESVAEVRVTWPDGSETVVTDVAVDQTITIAP